MRLRVLAAAAALCLCSLAMQAESFSVDFLRGDNVVLLGIDASGTVLVQETNTCTTSGAGGNCYEEWTNGAMSYRGESLPTSFVADNGAYCTPPPGAIGRSACNNGFQVWGGSFPFEVYEAYPGSDPLGQPVYSGTADGPMFVNSVGDFVTLDGLDDYLVEVRVSATPEPSSFALLGTGLLGMAGVLKRRFA